MRFAICRYCYKPITEGGEWWYHMNAETNRGCYAASYPQWDDSLRRDWRAKPFKGTEHDEGETLKCVMPLCSRPASLLVKVGRTEQFVACDEHAQRSYADKIVARIGDEH